MQIEIKNFGIQWDDFPNPCYSPQEKYGECPATFLDFMNDQRIPFEDKIWAFSACKKIDDRTKRLMAVKFVRETPITESTTVFDLLTDQRSIEALEIAEKFADGNATDDELAAARAAARAAREAAGAAAWEAAGAAWAAAWAAAWEAAGAAAWEAARAAAGAARAAAWEAAGAAQLQIICSTITP